MAINRRSPWMKGASKYRKGATAPTKNPRAVLERALVPKGAKEKRSNKIPARKPHQAPEMGPFWRAIKITKMKRKSGFIPKMFSPFRRVA
jgi:hypothetical protein